MKKDNRGISLIALIITIVVIVIVSAVAIFNGFTTVEKAGLSRFVTDASNFNSAVKYDYMTRIKYTPEYAGMTDEQIYYVMAKGIKPNKEVDVVPSQINWENIHVMPDELEGTEFYQVTDDRNILSWTKNMRYKDKETHFLSNKGEGFILPGYPIKTERGTKWYINEEKYYYTDITGKGIAHIEDENIAPPKDDPSQNAQETDVIEKPFLINSGEYKELYYVESNTKQCIDTGLKQSSDMHIYMKFQIVGKAPTLEGDNRIGVFGFANGGNKECAMFGYDSTGFYAIVDNWVRYKFNKNTIPVDQSIHILDMKSGSIKLDGVEAPNEGVFDGDPKGKNLDNVSLTGKKILTPTDKNVSLYLFGVHVGWNGVPNNAAYNGNVRIYEMIVTYDKNTEDTSDDEVYYFIPALRTLDSKPGMYKYDMTNEKEEFLVDIRNIAGFEYREVSVLQPDVPKIRNAYYDVNESAKELDVTTTSKDGGKITYQWYEADGPTEIGRIISGKTTSKYTPPTNAVGEKYYYAIVTNTRGNYEARIESNRAKISVIKGYMPEETNVPYGYTELEYVESNGKWVLDTGVSVGPNIKMELTFAALTPNSIGAIGWGGKGSRDGFGVAWSDDGQNFFCTNYGKYKLTPTSVTPDTNKHTVILENGRQVFDGVVNSEYTFVAPNSTALNTNIYLFALHSEWFAQNDTYKINNDEKMQVSKSSPTRVYECKIWDDGTLIRHYIPAMDSNDEVGMYDKVEGEFNLGIGQVHNGFIEGPEI